MRIYRYIIIGIVLLALIGCSSCTVGSTVPIEKIVYVPVKDTILEKTNIAKIVELEHKCNLLQDSLNNVRDSIGEDLFVARYKLSRIKYYNNIAKKGNNIRFLRGWIERVLNE